MMEQAVQESGQALEAVTDALSSRSPLICPDSEKALSLLKVDQRRYQKPNTLLTSAQLLLSFASSCRGEAPPIPEAQVQAKLVEAIHQFMLQVKKEGYRTYEIMAARYLLSALLDDLIVHSSWELASSWKEIGLLQEFAQESLESGRFFQVLRRCCDAPDTYLDLLELGYYCLSLGFMGSYRHESGGAQLISQMRDRLYHIITLFRGEPEAVFFWGEASPTIPRKRSIVTKFFRARLSGLIWLAIVALLALLYLPYRYHLHALSEPIRDSLTIPIHADTDVQSDFYSTDKIK